ncbi:MFS transporter [Streptomyces sp. NPDC006784]|uniref:MFS transporter n=1 Tax=Streptomyces sp. NPDC006784 TaxID=3364764 RepID=UPI003686E761
MTDRAARSKRTGGGPAPEPAGRSAGRSPERDHWLLVAVAGVLSFVVMLDMNIVNVALADISAALEVSDRTAQWAVLGYQLPVVALLLPAGRRLDQAGIRAALPAATAGFALCSALAAAAPSAGWLIAARFAQGGCAAVLFVLMPVLALRSVRPALRGRAMSVPATLGPLGAVTGPAVGGLLLDQWGWRWIFLVKIPFCLLVLLAVRGLPLLRGRPPAWESVLPRGGRLRAPDRRSLGDAALVAAGVTILLLALTLASDSSAWLALTLAAAPPLWWWLRGPGGRPVLDVLRTTPMAHTLGAVLTLALGFAAARYLLALHLQRDAGASATTTGLTVLAFPLGMALAGPLGGRLADRFRTRGVAVTGAALTACGLLLLVPLDDGWSPADIAWRLGLAGAGMGLNGGPTQALAMGAAPADRAATVGSALQLSRMLGFTLGPALATAAWGLAGPGSGVRAGIVLAGCAACLAVPLLGRDARAPTDPAPDGAAPQAAPAARR